MYSNLYNAYNQQTNLERINSQIAELEKIKQQLSQNPMPQATNLTQNFQLAPANNNSIKYANSIEDIKKEIVIADTPFFSRDLSVVWIKNAKGDIKAYELKEIVQKDDKDLMIESLQLQINEMRKEIANAKPIITNVDEPIESEEPSSVPIHRASKTKQK